MPITVIQPDAISQSDGIAVSNTNSIGRDWSGFWPLVPVLPNDSPAVRNLTYRLNALGSLFYFSKVILRRHRLTENLHKPICELFEVEKFKYLIEFPRDHFKSTLVSECLPIWWALPFTQQDQDAMFKLIKMWYPTLPETNTNTNSPSISANGTVINNGYTIENWFKYMHLMHNPNTRTLLASSNITNAAKIGKRISGHYDNSPIFRELFKSILPDSSCTWSAFSLTHKRDINITGFNHGEGTYEFIGVGGALQSRHFVRVIEDDLAGREIIDSDVSYDDIIDWHQLLVGAFDSNPLDPNATADEAVVSNCWAYRDLNSYIKKNEPQFKVISHGAEGGCCSNHPPGTPIFPEEFSMQKLAEIKQRLTKNGSTYFYTCQYQNRPSLPGNTFFKEEWLNRFRYDTISDEDKRIKIVHILTAEQEQLCQTNLKLKKEFDFVMPGNMDSINIIVDLNHKEQEGSCNHAIAVVGYVREHKRMYLLDCWAASTSFDDLCEMIYKYGDRWHKQDFWCEEIAAQRLLRYPVQMHFETLKKKDGKFCNKLKWLKSAMNFKPLKVERSRDFKKKIIDALEPLFNGMDGTFWIPLMSAGSDINEFVDEYLKWPHGSTVDLLNCIGYAPRLLGISQSKQDIEAFMTKRQAFVQGRRSGSNPLTGY